jgi:hypothetical protein
MIEYECGAIRGQSAVMIRTVKDTAGVRRQIVVQNRSGSEQGVVPPIPLLTHAPNIPHLAGSSRKEVPLRPGGRYVLIPELASTLNAPTTLQDARENVKTIGHVVGNKSARVKTNVRVPNMGIQKGNIPRDAVNRSRWISCGRSV